MSKKEEYCNSKYSDSDDSDYDSKLPYINVVDINIDSTDLLTDGFTINIEWEINQDIEDAIWKVSFIVDSAGKRYITVLGETEPKDYDEGSHDLEYTADHIDISNIPPSSLSNMGMLVFSLRGRVHERMKEIIDVNMVVSVKEENGVLKRRIFNPLD